MVGVVKVGVVNVAQSFPPILLYFLPKSNNALRFYEFIEISLNFYYLFDAKFSWCIAKFSLTLSID